jgi:hypothetical protein
MAPGRRPVMLGGHLLAERLLRPLVVVVLAKGIEARLLPLRVGRRRPRVSAFSIRCIRSVGVLLRLTGLDVLEPDSEPDAVHHKAREAAGADGRERRAAVGAH